MYCGKDINGPARPAAKSWLGDGVIENFDFPDIESCLDTPTSNFSMRIMGQIGSPEAGLYWFRLSSDEGSGLAINRQVVIHANHPKAFSAIESQILIEQSLDTIEVCYLEQHGAAGLRLERIPPGEEE
jgi:PA14 domain-containing protein